MNASHLEGNVLFHQQEIRNARQIYETIYAYGESTNSLTWVAREARTLAHCDLELGALSDAARYFHLALKAFSELGEAAEVTKTRWGIALLLLRSGKADEALARFRKVAGEFPEISVALHEPLRLPENQHPCHHEGALHDIRRLHGRRERRAL